MAVRTVLRLWVAWLMLLTGAMSSVARESVAQQTDASVPSKPAADVQRLLYVASPGIRNDLEYGGHGLLVFDIDDGHRFVRRIPIGGLDEHGRPINVKGICASADAARVWISTLRSLMCVDLVTDRLLWEREYPGGCDRMSVTPDGSVIYLPSLEKDHWHVVDGMTGDVITRIEPRSGAHNTIIGPGGRRAYLAGLRSPVLTICDAKSHQVVVTCGPFADNIRPFTINEQETRVYVCINNCLGFEIGDLTTGRRLRRIEVPGVDTGPVKRHGCPSHGIGLTPDEREIWVTDGHNNQMHVFDATVEPPRLIDSLPLRDQPGWITFSIDGRWAWPSSGEVIDRRTRTTVALLTDEQGRAVGSEKMLEIDFQNGRPIRTGDQFGRGMVTDLR